MTALTSRFAYLRVLVFRELQQLIRDPVALILTLVAPVVAAMIASAALGSPPKIDATIAVVGSGSSLDNAAQLAVVGASGRDTTLRWHVLNDQSQARRMVSDGMATAALILPPAGAPAPTPVGVVVNRNARLVADLATSAARTIATRLSVTRALRAGDGPAGPGTPPPIAVSLVSPHRRALNGAELYGPVIAVFFLFLASNFIARSMRADHERGTLARLRVMPLGTGTIIAGKLVTMLVVGLAEFATVLVVMSLVSHAHWGNLLTLSAVVLALTLAIGAVGLVNASISRSFEAASRVGPLVALGFAVLGGNLVPLQNLPPIARRIADFTPNGVAIRGMRDVEANRAGLPGVAGALFLILGFTIVVGGIGYSRLRRRVEG